MESFLANLKQQVQCSLCKETMTDPKLAYCFHTFCKNCIKTNTQQDDEGENNVFKCPQCDSQTLLQDLNDVEDLQDNPLHSRILHVLPFVENEKDCSVSASHPQALWHCLVCNQSLCEECLRSHSKFTKNHHVALLSDLKKEDVEKMLQRESPCKTHDEQDVEFYCHDCDMLICLYCMKDLHRNHKTKTLQEFVAIKKDSMFMKLEQITKLTKDENEKKQQEQFALLMQRDSEKAKQEIKDLTKKLKRQLEDNEQQLLNKVEKNKTKANNNLRIIRCTAQAQEFIRKFVEVGTASDLVSCQQIDRSNAFMYEPYPQDTTGIAFNHNEELCKQVKNGLGQVRPFKKADPKMSTIEVDSSNIEALKKSKLKVNLKTSKGDNTDETLDNVSIHFTPEDNVEVEEVQMTDDGEITVDFTPRVCAELTVDVQVHGSIISNSPLVMDVKPQEIKEMTGHSTLKDALNTGSKSFCGIAVNKENSKIAVADWDSHCIRVFNMEGDLLLTYGSQGSEQGQLNRPHGLAFLNETDLVIADRHNHRICIVNTATGQLLRAFGSHGDSNGEFDEPCGLHVDSNSNIIVCDWTNKRIQVFTNDGNYLYQIREGNPFSILEQSGLFYVANLKNSLVCVAKMNENQSLTTVTTIDGNSGGQLQEPFGLAIDNDNNLIVSDYDNNVIHKFTLDGRYIGQSVKLPSCPCYMVVLSDGRIICTTEGSGVIFFNN